MVKTIKPILSKGGISLKYQPEHIKYINHIKKLSKESMMQIFRFLYPELFLKISGVSNNLIQKYNEKNYNSILIIKK